MKNLPDYLMNQIAQFGALKVSQMLELCEGLAGKSSIYRALNVLKEHQYIVHGKDAKSGHSAFMVSPEGRKYVLGENITLVPGPKNRELNHTLACAESLFRISRHENVIGITTTFGLDAEQISHFCHDRIPDGIFRLRQNGEEYDLALEVETTSRSESRLKEFLHAYWSTFRSAMPCTGVVIAAGNQTIFDQFDKLIKKMPPEFQSRTSLHSGIGFKDIKLSSYGIRKTTRPECWDLSGKLIAGRPSFSPIISRGGLAKPPTECLIDLRSDKT